MSANTFSEFALDNDFKLGDHSLLHHSLFSVLHLWVHTRCMLISIQCLIVCF